MTLFKVKEAVRDVQDARADKPKKANRFQQMAADNKVLRDENGRLRAKVNALESRVTSLEGFQSDQETFNAGTRERVGRLQRTADGTALVCPGCGQPSAEGVHGVTCFTTVADA